MENSVLMLVNPAAGRSMSNVALGSAVSALCEAGYVPEVVYTVHPGSISDQVASLAADQERLICLGGDGTLSDTIAGLMQLPPERRPLLGYIPMGTANDVATTLGLPMRQPRKAVERILHGTPLCYDVGEMEGIGYFSYITAFGAFTEISYKTDQNMKKALGHLAYVLNGITALNAIKPIHARVETDAETVEGDYIYGAVSNSLSVAGLVKMDPHQVDLSDGLFEILLVEKPASAQELSSIVTGVLNQNYDHAHLRLLHASRVKFSFAAPVSWTRDGENGGEHTELTLSCHQHAVNICR